MSRRVRRPRVTRRSLLRATVGAAIGLVTVPPGGGARRRATASGGPEPAGLDDATVSEMAALASLGGWLMRSDPAAAGVLADEIRRRCPTPAAPAADRALWAMRHELTAGRVTADLAAARLVAVDGWMVARAEAAVCAYLHTLAAGAC